MVSKENIKYKPGKECPGVVGVDHCVICEGCKFSDPPYPERVNEI